MKVRSTMWFQLGLGLIVLVIGWKAIDSFFRSLPLPDVHVAHVARPVTKKPAPVKKAEKKPLPAPVQIKAYEPEVKAELKLPKSIIEAPEEVAIEAVVIESSERPQSVVTVMNTETGETSSFVKYEPLPWFKPESRGSLSFDVGYRYSDPKGVDPVGRLNLRYDVLQVKGLHLGLSASAYTDGELFGGIGINYRW